MIMATARLPGPAHDFRRSLGDARTNRPATGDSRHVSPLRRAVGPAPDRPAADGASAQNGAPDTENGRYSFNRVEDGYLRLDQRTGQVSVCARRNLGWSCHPVPDERTALEDEIARLQRDNAALKKEMLARGITPPGGSAAQAPSPTEKPAAERCRAMPNSTAPWR